MNLLQLSLAITRQEPAGRPSLNLDFLNSSTLDPRITFTRASNATRFNSSGVLTTAAANDPRFDYDPVTLAPLGLLLEEQRTNSIRNSTMVGAAAGTPGTLPTNWTISSPGVTSSVVGSGSVNGLPYVDVRFAGTTNSTSGTVVFDTSSAIAATQNQTWSISGWVALVGGSTSNVTSMRFIIDERSAANSYLLSNTQPSFQASVASTPTRFSYTATLSNASTAYIQPFFRFTCPTASAIDFTVRLAAPQIEQGAFATSFIPTSTVAVQRSADVASMSGTNFSSWYNASAGTFLVEGSTASFANSPIFLMPHDGSSTNYINAPILTTSGLARFAGVIGGVAMTNVNTSNSATVNTNLKAAAAFQASDQAICLNAGTVATGTNASLPAVNTLQLGNWRSGAGNSINGYLRRISYFPRRLSNSELQALTA